MSGTAYKIYRPCEILNGIRLEMMASPTPLHNLIAGNIYNIFYNYFKGNVCKALMAPTDVWFSENDLTEDDRNAVIGSFQVRLFKDLSIYVEDVFYDN